MKQMSHLSGQREECCGDDAEDDDEAEDDEDDEDDKHLGGHREECGDDDAQDNEEQPPADTAEVVLPPLLSFCRPLQPPPRKNPIIQTTPNTSPFLVQLVFILVYHRYNVHCPINV